MIMFLQHVMGTVLRRPYEIAFKTLSLGDEECRVAVLETDDPLAGYTDKVEQRFVDKSESG
jgi:hypothetical protein